MQGAGLTLDLSSHDRGPSLEVLDDNRRFDPRLGLLVLEKFGFLRHDVFLTGRKARIKMQLTVRLEGQEIYRSLFVLRLVKTRLKEAQSRRCVASGPYAQRVSATVLTSPAAPSLVSCSGLPASGRAARRPECREPTSSRWWDHPGHRQARWQPASDIQTEIISPDRCLLA